MSINKKGFFSVAVVYSFLILFIMLLFMIVSSYLVRDNLINNIVNDAKTELENE